MHRSMVRGNRILSKNNTKTALALDCAGVAFLYAFFKKADKVGKLIDELVEAVKILHPRMYTTFIDKVQDL